MKYVISVIIFLLVVNLASCLPPPDSFDDSINEKPEPLPEGWIFCAKEHEYCVFNDTALVRYGLNENYSYQNHTDGVLCSNSIFGDPYKGVMKECHYSYTEKEFDAGFPTGGINQPCRLDGTCDAAYICKEGICSEDDARKSTYIKLYGTEEDVILWTKRSQFGPYRVLGDAFMNSPPDWQRVVEMKNAVMAGNLGSHNWDIKYDGTLPVKPTNQAEARHKSRALAAAALWALVNPTDPERNQVLERVKETLLLQPDQYLCDFHDRELYPFDAYYDLYIFAHAHAMTSQLIALDLLQAAGVEFSDGELLKLDNWHAGFAELGERETHTRTSRPFVNRTNRDYTLTSWGINTAGKSIHWVDDPWWWMSANGTPSKKTTYLSNLYNNRQASHARYFGLYGLKFNHPFYVERAILFVEEFVKYHMFPNGGAGELHRFKDTSPSEGLDYLTLAHAHLMTFVDALYRTGDNSLLDFVTIQGAHGSEGAPDGEVGKSLRWQANVIAKYFHHEYDDRYAVRSSIDRLGNSDYLLYPAVVNRGMQNRLVVGNEYWNDEYIRFTYRNVPYPQNEPYSWDAGDSGVFPAHMLMFADREPSLS